MPTFTLLTYNCLGLRRVGTRRRLLTLAHELEEAPYDVVCLQEVQAVSSRKLLIQACASYTSAYAPNVYGARGGLLTLSRRPISWNQYIRYRERGRWCSPAIMDWPLHKGVLYTSLALGDLVVVVLNTHLNPNYRGNWSSNNHFARTERAQLRQLAEIVDAQPSTALVVVAGDFNVPRASRLYDEFLALSGLEDPLAGDSRPTYRPPPVIPRRYALPFDFVLTRPPRLPGLQAQVDLRFRERLPLIGGGAGFLSDHYAVELRLSWPAPGSEGHALGRLDEAPPDQGTQPQPQRRADGD
jgi:endonuclease/exonuclease/phosphatase family metal-dependent hydrolase